MPEPPSSLVGHNRLSPGPEIGEQRFGLPPRNSYGAIPGVPGRETPEKLEPRGASSADDSSRSRRMVSPRTTLVTILCAPTGTNAVLLEAETTKKAGTIRGRR